MDTNLGALGNLECCFVLSSLGYKSILSQLDERTPEIIKRNNWNIPESVNIEFAEVFNALSNEEEIWVHYRFGLNTLQVVRVNERTVVNIFFRPWIDLEEELVPHLRFLSSIATNVFVGFELEYNHCKDNCKEQLISCAGNYPFILRDENEDSFIEYISPDSFNSSYISLLRNVVDKIK